MDNEISSRIKQLREALGLSQIEFAKKVKLGAGTIKNIEYDLIKPNKRYYEQIAEACNVDPVWLETGEGEMFRKLSRDEQIAAFVGKALADDSDDFVRQTIAMLAALDEAGWQKLKAAAEAIAEAQKKAEE